MNEPMELSLEQQFNLQSFKSQVEKMSHQQAQEFLVKLYEQMIYKEALYKKILKYEWRIDTVPNMEKP